MKKKQLKKPHSIDHYELPERLNYLRQLRGLTQARLAKKAQVSQSTVAQIEKGKKDPSISTLKKIAKALDVELAIFFASDSVHIFDMNRLIKNYKSVDDLNPTLYMALGKLIQYAKDIGYLK